jgi:hypothetical protein
MLVKNEKVRFILEIEETGLTPTKICGKFLTSALSTHFIHDILSNAAFAMDTNVTFAQVIDAKNLEPRTKKIRQGESLERSIRSILPLRSSGVSRYQLFFFRGVEDFQSGESMDKRSDLRRAYEEACA